MNPSEAIVIHVGALSEVYVGALRECAINQRHKCLMHSDVTQSTGSPLTGNGASA